MASKMVIEGFFDPATSTISYLLLDPRTKACAIIDPVLDYDADSGHTSTKFADRLISRIRELHGHVEWILETHAHADHLSAAPYFKNEMGGKTAIGSGITDVQKIFGEVFNAGPEFARDGSQFDCLLSDDQVIDVGALKVTAMHTPGHTPACMTYVATDGDQLAAFVGDTLFMPDYGTARCDFPGGDASTLYESIKRVLKLPSDTRLFTCHDYQPNGRAMQFESTVAAQCANNVHVHDGVSAQEFATMRNERDATLSLPKLILPSVQVNMRAGLLPEPESNGTRYIKIPLNVI